MTLHKYYMTQRPPMIGAMPHIGLKDIHDYDGKIFLPELGCKAWGYVGYTEKLTIDETEIYELTYAGTYET